MGPHYSSAWTAVGPKTVAPPFPSCHLSMNLKLCFHLPPQLSIPTLPVPHGPFAAMRGGIMARLKRANVLSADESACVFVRLRQTPN